MALYWGAAQLGVFLVVYLACYCYVKRSVNEINTERAALVDPRKNDVGHTQIDFSQIIRRTDGSAIALPDTISCGVYLDRIMRFDIVNSIWEYECYIWFKWKPWQINFIGGYPVSDPRNTPFKIVDGEIKSVKLQTYRTNNYDSAYVLYFVSASCTQFFQVQLFPFDRNFLAIKVEPAEADIKKIYIAEDSTGSGVSSRAKINGYALSSPLFLSKPHTYNTTLGDVPDSSALSHDVTKKRENEGLIIKAGDKKTVSQTRFLVEVKRGNGRLAIYLKLFASLFIAVLIAFLSFFAGDGRISIVIGSFYASVASLYLLISKIPVTSEISLGELVNSVSLITVFFILANETIVKSYIKGNKELLRLNHWITFYISLFMYVIFNVTMILTV